MFLPLSSIFLQSYKGQVVLHAMTVYIHSFLALTVMNGQAVCCAVSSVLHQLELYVFNCSVYSHLHLVGLCGMSVQLCSVSITLGSVKKANIALFISVAPKPKIICHYYHHYQAFYLCMLSLGTDVSKHMSSQNNCLSMQPFYFYCNLYKGMNKLFFECTTYRES